jgi:Holliday junction resolvase RusA-like endonuclease
MLSFTITGIPPSYNRSLNINYNFKEVYLSKEAHSFKTRIKATMPPYELSDNSIIRLEIEYHSDFKYKNGKNKKIDLQNMDKLLIDAIFEKLGVDDSAVWELQQRKVQDKEDFTKIELREI